MTDIVQLGHLPQGFLTGQDPAVTWAEYRHIIEDGITNQPRSLQTRIGPSELGNTCDRCLVLKLGGTPEPRSDAMWLPFIGSAVHAALEPLFAQANADLPFVRYLIESRVSVGTVGGVDITGCADLFDTWTGEVTDWKIPGKNTLTKTKAHGPTDVYKRQAHLYGLGFVRRGLTVNRVRIAMLPRNEQTLNNAVIWDEPYNEQVALDTLNRADMFATAIQHLGLDAVLTDTPPHNGDEFSCARYDSAIPSPGHRYPPGSDLKGLIAS